MTLNNLFTCPNCGANKTALKSSRVMLEDIRVDDLACVECDAQWRGYSKVTAVESELLFVPQKDSAPVVEQPTEVVEEAPAVESTNE